MKSILLFLMLCPAFDVQSASCYDDIKRIKSVLNEADPDKELSCSRQKLIFSCIGFSNNPSTLDDVLETCLQEGQKKMAYNSFIATLVGVGANISDVISGSSKKDEYIVTVAKATKKHLLCNEQVQFKILLGTKLFSGWLLNDWLLLAADTGRYEALQPLIQAGATVCATDSDGNTILHLLTQDPYKKEVPSPSDIMCSNAVALEVLAKKNREGETFLDCADPKKETGQKMIQGCWDRFVQEGIISVGDRSPSYTRKKKLMLDVLKKQSDE